MAGRLLRRLSDRVARLLVRTAQGGERDLDLLRGEADLGGEARNRRIARCLRQYPVEHAHGYLSPFAMFRWAVTVGTKPLANSLSFGLSPEAA